MPGEGKDKGTAAQAQVADVAKIAEARAARKREEKAAREKGEQQELSTGGEAQIPPEELEEEAAEETDAGSEEATDDEQEEDAGQEAPEESGQEPQKPEQAATLAVDHVIASAQAMVARAMEAEEAQPEAPAAAAQAQPAAKADEKVEPGLPEGLLDEFDEDTQKAFKSYAAHFEKRLQAQEDAHKREIEALKGQVGQQAKGEQEREEAAAKAEFEGFMAKLPKALKTLYGTGTVEELAKDPVKNAAALEKRYNFVLKALKLQKSTGMPRAEAFNIVNLAENPDFYRQQELEGVSRSLKRQASQMTARPTTRAGKALSKKEAAVEAAKQAQAARKR